MIRHDPERETAFPGLLTASLRDPAVWALVQSVQRISEHADQRSTPRGGKNGIPATVGGQTLTATVLAAMGVDGDTRVPHRLGRIAQAIVHVEATEDPNDRLTGRPEGGQGISGGNETPWDDKAVYVRSNVAAGRQFVFTIT